MDVADFPRRAACIAASLVLLSCLGAGCQNTHVSSARLIEHQAMIDISGLRPVQTINELKVLCALPQDWDPLPLQKTAVYSHQQWRSPTHATGVGVAYIHLPIPLNPKMIIWFAKGEYTKKQTEGRLIAQWTDDTGREWFEAENNKYHVKGYAVCKGFDAWIIYSGYKVVEPQNGEECTVAERCADTVLPVPLASEELEKASATVAADSEPSGIQ